MRKIVVLLCWIVLVLPMSAATPTAKPEEVGLSSDRLKRIHDLVQRHLDVKSFSGAVTLVARNGRIGHFEAQGLMDIESNRPMQKDAIFRIMSMTKPVVGVSILMMIEEGKVRLPIRSRSGSPSSRACGGHAANGARSRARRPPAAPGGPAPAPRFYTVPPSARSRFATC